MESLFNKIIIPEKYEYQFIDGIYKVNASQFQNKLDAYLKQFLTIQSKENQFKLGFNQFHKFPNINCPELATEIFTRKQDVQIIEEYFSGYLKPNNNVLEIGGWIGWLTSFLSSKELNIISADIFEDEQNGLKSKKYHPKANWLSVQTDVLQTEVYNVKFDVIIFNHCLQFYTDPHHIIEKYKLLLNKNGLLLIIGNTFYKKESSKQKNVLKTKEYFFNKYQFDIQFYQSKGYFSYNDFNEFKKSNFKFISYQFSLLGMIKKKLKQEKSGIIYFINS